MKETILKYFPIQSGWSSHDAKAFPPTKIPWEMISPHEAQALHNHAGQSLKRLAERGGLSYCEAVAVLEDREWTLMNVDESIFQLNKLVQDFNLKINLSDTPLTDSQPIRDSNGLLFTSEELKQNRKNKLDPYHGGLREYVDAEFARMLERELNKLKK